MWPFGFPSCQQIWTASAADKHELRAQAAVEAVPATVPTILTLRDALATAACNTCCQTARREVGRLLLSMVRLAWKQFLSSAVWATEDRVAFCYLK